jgi:hypothetical protein|tara:strand:+ start:553 stop:837 length:285 start_codon:yes stop_codon:yes gene_type:complete
MGESSESDWACKLLSSDMVRNRISEFPKVGHTPQLQLDSVEIVAILKVFFSVDKSEHWRRQHFFAELFVVFDVSKSHYDIINFIIELKFDFNTF